MPGRIAEIGTAEEVFHDPRHPYTWGLMRAVPAFARGRDSLYAIPGMPPVLIDPPKGTPLPVGTNMHWP